MAVQLKIIKSEIVINETYPTRRIRPAPNNDTDFKHRLLALDLPSTASSVMADVLTFDKSDHYQSNKEIMIGRVKMLADIASTFHFREIHVQGKDHLQPVTTQAPLLTSYHRSVIHLTDAGTSNALLIGAMKAVTQDIQTDEKAASKYDRDEIGKSAAGRTLKSIHQGGVSA